MSLISPVEKLSDEKCPAESLPNKLGVQELPAPTIAASQEVMGAAQSVWLQDDRHRSLLGLEADQRWMLA